jgi:hypothetical protein
MPSPQHTKSRHKAKKIQRYVYAAALAAVWLASLARPSRGAVGTHIDIDSVPAAADGGQTPQPTLVSAVRNTAPEPTAAISSNGPPVVHEIKLDKDSVCRGELNFINVRASDADGSDAHLRIALTGTVDIGPRIPFRLYESLTADEMPRIKVEGSGLGEVFMPLPPLTVKDCDEPQLAQLDIRTVGASTDEWRFSTRVTRGEHAAVSYEWEFGDGTRETTREPTVTHSYRYRSQDKRYASFVTTVTLRDAHGKPLTATGLVSMSNPAFGLLHRHGEVAVFARRTEAADGEHVQLYHAHHAPVKLERVAVRLRPVGGGAELPLGSFDAPEVLGIEHMIPGEPKEVLPQLGGLPLPDHRPLLLVFELSGTSTDSFPLNGMFSLLVR